MLEKGLMRFSVTDSQTGEKVDLLRPIPTKTPWGILACLRDTEVGLLIPTVSGEDMSQALHGRFRPLRRALGRAPFRQLQKLEGDMTCTLILECILADRGICLPHKKMPHCYSPPGHTGLTAHAISTVVRAWADQRFVIVVEGAEFSY